MKNKPVIFSLLFLLSCGVARACTIISCSINDKVFVAANEDEYTPFTRVWFNPASNGRYRYVLEGQTCKLQQL